MILEEMELNLFLAASAPKAKHNIELKIRKK